MGDLFVLNSRPGVRRDGTELDSPFHADGVWVRWQRGKPRKMGGYLALSQFANGPVRSVLVDSRNARNTAHLFSQWGVQRLAFDVTGAAGSVDDRTPVAGFAPNPAYTWTQAAMYSGVGSTYAGIIAACAPDLNDIASDVAGTVWSGDINATNPLTQVSDGSGPITVSGGVTVLQPFLVVYGSNGLIRNSNANNYSAASGWTTGGSNFANTANVAGTKIVHGAPVRGGGQAPAGLFWAMDSLIRMSFVGGTAIWAYDTLSSPTSIMSKKCVVELDGKFFWIGTDRFLFYNGVVQELPNDMNQNYFFDNLNYAYRNLVWGTKVPRFGEIWWFYPRGTDTECNDAIIYNYRENTWYDAVCKRSAGDVASLVAKPIWCGGTEAQQTLNIPTGLRVTTNADVPVGSNVVHLPSAAGISIGMLVTGHAGVPPNTTVTGFTGPTDITVSNNVTSTVPSGTTLNISWMTTAFPVGSTVTGATNGATGTVFRVTEVALNLNNVNGVYGINEVLNSSSTGTAKVYAAPFTQELDLVYQHERGWDKVIGQNVVAINSSFTSHNFGYAIGSPMEDLPKSAANKLTRVIRIEPDFDQVGDMTFEVQGRSYANEDTAVLSSDTFAHGTQFVDPRQQSRIMRLKFGSSSVGGFYQQGQVMVELEPGDDRPTTGT